MVSSQSRIPAPITGIVMGSDLESTAQSLLFKSKIQRVDDSDWKSHK